MRTTISCLCLVLVALLACKEKKSEPAAVATAEPAAVPAPALTSAAPVEAPVESFAGTYTSSYGTAKCTQIKKNVNCIYAGKSGALDCKITGDKVLECDWDDSGGTGKAKLTKQADGSLKGSWGYSSSASNGGGWVFKPKAP